MPHLRESDPNMFLEGGTSVSYIYPSTLQLAELHILLPYEFLIVPTSAVPTYLSFLLTHREHLSLNPVHVQTMLRIWDVFLLEGPKVLFRFALAILCLHESSVMEKADTISVMKILKAAARLTYDTDGLIKVWEASAAHTELERPLGLELELARTFLRTQNI